jgi:stage V sporulation protein B
MKKPDAEMTRNIAMGTGTFYLMLSAFFFTFSGYAIHIGLGRYFGPEKYGIYGVIISAMTVVNLMLNSGIPGGTSKFISEQKKWQNLHRKALQVQLLFSLFVAVIYFLTAPYIADMLNDSSLTPYLRLSSFVIPLYALNSLYHQGFLNGYKKYGKQAITRSGFSVAKVAAIFAFVAIGLGVNGAILGYLSAAFIGFLIGMYYTRKVAGRADTKNASEFPSKKLVSFAIPIILYSIAIFLVFNIDLLAVKAILTENIDTGFYTSATNIARLPYFVFGGLALTLLPSISHSSSRKDLLQSQDYITKSLRYMVMLLLPSVLLISATATPLVSLLYSGAYSAAGQPLQILILGLGCLAVFNVLAHVVMGSGKPGVAAGAATTIFALALLLNLYLIPRYGMDGAAMATTIASAIGLTGITLYVYKRFRALMDAVSFIKILAASVIVAVVAYLVTFRGLLLVVEYIALLMAYLGLLWLMREIKQEDIETAERIIPLPIRLPRIGW